MVHLRHIVGPQNTVAQCNVSVSLKSDAENLCLNRLRQEQLNMSEGLKLNKPGQLMWAKTETSTSMQ